LPRTTSTNSTTEPVPHPLRRVDRGQLSATHRRIQQGLLMSKPRLEMQGISKRYGGVRAIRNADLVVEPGSVHALVGENGAGKSTLIKILAGAEQADTGSIAIDG